MPVSSLRQYPAALLQFALLLRRGWSWLALLLSVAAAGPVGADDFPITLTDLAGRQVTLEASPRHLFLDNPRHLFALAALLPDPVARLSGWRGSLAGFDDEAQRRFESAFPALTSLPQLGGAANGLVSAEALASLAPDLIVADISRYADWQGSPRLRQLDALEIPVLFVDFRRHPLVDGPRSLALLGRALGVSPRADALIARLQAASTRVDDCLEGLTQRPRVLIDIAPGLKVDCCRSNFDSGLADLVADAEGDNIAAGFSPGTENVLSPEAVLASDPDVIIATAARWRSDDSVRAGFGVDPARTQQDLAAVVARRAGWPALSAIKAGRLHALWHGYHQGPFAPVALQAIAGWLHPQQCGALDPQATLTALYRDFMPIAADGTFQADYASEAARL
ncbi:ABC transporter substrate-binding protein [Salinicola avicenniae]|uniref:ABC transporter substrate-binding protein n=1 Tax=Salinicola avicenniae TaxID=2916836 RepID=UPI002073A106|nr:MULTISPECIES: ABC transporter substrate-binding protein [unclassified Salinicola]